MFFKPIHTTYMIRINTYEKKTLSASRNNAQKQIQA